MYLIKLLQWAWSGETKGGGKLQHPSLEMDSHQGQDQWPCISRSDKLHEGHSGQNIFPIRERRPETEEGERRRPPKGHLPPKIGTMN